MNTDVLTVAKLRLADEAAKIEKTRGAKTHVEAGSGSVGELMEIDPGHGADRGGM